LEDIASMARAGTLPGASTCAPAARTACG